MKNVRLVNNVVFEVLPEEAIPIEKWYNEAFAKECVEAPDEVDQGWVYDSENDVFLEPGSAVAKKSEPLELLLNAVIE